MKSSYWLTAQCGHSVGEARNRQEGPTGRWGAQSPNRKWAPLVFWVLNPVEDSCLYSVVIDGMVVGREEASNGKSSAESGVVQVPKDACGEGSKRWETRRGTCLGVGEWAHSRLCTSQTFTTWQRNDRWHFILFHFIILVVLGAGTLPLEPLHQPRQAFYSCFLSRMNFLLISKKKKWKKIK
jgi:hypothetical protein